MAPMAISVSKVEGEHIREKSKTTVFVVVVAAVAACGGLLFGFDNGITGGVIAQPDFAARFFPDTLNPPAESSPFCQFNDHVMQLFVSSLFLAGAASALFGMFTSRRWGRKPTMVLGGLCFLIGTVLVASAFETAQLVIGRVVLGFGVGFATQATPLYLSEMAPFHLRGALNILFQLMVTLGILGAQLINYGTRNMENGWRLSLAMGAVPALILFVGALMLPETPSSLVERGHLERGRHILKRLRGTEDVDAELSDICTAVAAAAAIKNEWTAIFKRRYSPQLVISILVPCFQQWTGINAIMFYAPQLFQSLGHGTDASLLNTVVIGCVNVGSTLVSIAAVDRVGRKMLFLEGGLQMILTNVVAGVLIQRTTYVDPGNDAMAAATLAMICIFVAGFAWSWGPLGWLVPSEIQPLETRTSGTAISTASNFLMTFVVGQCFLSMLCAMEYGVFFFFAGMVVIMTIFTQMFVPETRNVPIEEVETELFAKHWFWGRVILNGPPEASDADTNSDAASSGDDKVAAKV